MNLSEEIKLFDYGLITNDSIFFFGGGAGGDETVFLIFFLDNSHFNYWITLQEGNILDNDFIFNIFLKLFQIKIPKLFFYFKKK